MSNQESHFEDPELKAAIIRARGGHVARPELREQVVRRLAQVRAELESESGSSKGGSSGHAASAIAAPTMRIAGTAADSSPSQSKTSRKPWFLSRTFLAAAAMLIISIGAASMYINHLQHEAEEREEYLEANRPLLTAMIDTLGNGGAVDPNPEVMNATTDPRALAKEMSKRLGREVPPVNLAGWKIEAVSICKVGPAQAQAGHWQLTKDGKRIAVLSLPASAFNIEEYEDYDFRLNDHAIAGFLRHGSINCIVCEPSFTDRQAKQMRDELKRG